MKIVPLGIPDDSKGKPVEVLKMEGEGASWNIVIRCEMRSHTLSFNQGRLVRVHDHEDADIKNHEALAELSLGHLNAICECVKVKLWYQEVGITIIEDMFP